MQLKVLQVQRFMEERHTEAQGQGSSGDLWSARQMGESGLAGAVAGTCLGTKPKLVRCIRLH